MASPTRRCGVCFAMNLVDESHCGRCGARLPEEDREARAERLACPGCGAAMTSRRLSNIAFDECDACGGLWLTPGTAEGVATEAATRAQLRAFDAPPLVPAPGHETARIAYRPCPTCRKMMNRSQYAHGSGVVVDLCRDHGSYYDRGELTRIFAFVESGGLEKARHREAESLKEDLRDLRRKAISLGAGMPTPSERGAETSARFGALELLRWIADYLAGGKRSANSG